MSPKPRITPLAREQALKTSSPYIPFSAPEALMDWREHVWIDPERMHGLACMRGTRIPVHVILDNLAAGESAESILGEYPTLRAEHIRAALAFAAELAHERVVPIPAQPMRFKLDENMPRRARQRLESRGWEVHDVHQEGLASRIRDHPTGV